MKLRTTFCVLITLFILLISVTTSSAQVQHIYWAETEANKIGRANLDGTNRQNLIRGFGKPIGITVDIAGGKVYWTDRDRSNLRDPAGRNSIHRANLDGTNIETLVIGGNGVKEYIDLDISGGKMYWTEWSHFGPGNIQRANLDGSNVEDLVTGLTNPNAFALDVSKGKMYWGDIFDNPSKVRIQRASLDGSNIEDLFITDSAHDITLDAAGVKIYWTNSRAGKIQYANLDGSNVEDIVTGLRGPLGIALDDLNSKIYWAEYSGGKIQRANLNGTNVEDLVTGLRGPIGIALGIPQTSAGLRFSPNTIADQNFTVDIPVDTTLPFAVGGSPPYSYTLSALPAGLYFDTTTRQIRGTPTTLTSAHPVTYTVTDAAGQTASLTFTITVQTTYGTNVYMYWTDLNTNKIQRANLDGTNIVNLITTGITRPNDIGLDLAGGKMYWTDLRSKIQRANLNGTNIEDILTGLGAPDGIALDVVSQKMYWTEQSTHKIRRANFDGSNIEDLVTTGLRGPDDIGLDLVAGKMYWTNNQTSQIQRANFDGSNVENLVSTTASGIALDVVGGKMYWTSHGGSEILRANLDGTNVENVITTAFGNPEDIKLAVAGGKIYWTEWAGKIRRANLNGTNVEDLVTGLVSPVSIALGIPETFGGLRFDPNVVADQTFTVGTAVSLTLPTAMGGTPPYTYTLAPTLPAGLSFDPIANGPGHIGGTPTAILPATPFTYTATDVRGASASLTFTITVELNLDVNSDGKVDVLDLVWVAVSYQMRGDGLRADVNADGVVNVQDLVAVAGGVDAAAVLPAKVAEEVALAAEAAAAREGVSAGAPRMRFSSPSGRASGLTTHRNVAAALADVRSLVGSDVRLRGWLPLLERLLQVLSEMKAIPETTALLPNYPNPFNPETWIPYHLAQAANVTLTIYDVRGGVVRTLRLGHQPAGVYQSRGRAAYWDGRNQIGEQVASGLYFYTLTAGDFTATCKMLIRK